MVGTGMGPYTPRSEFAPFSWRRPRKSWSSPFTLTSSERATCPSGKAGDEQGIRPWSGLEWAHIRHEASSPHFRGDAHGNRGHHRLHLLLLRGRPAPQGRQETSKEFAHGRDWNGPIYATKRVRPIFVETPTEIVVITVYTY